MLERSELSNLLWQKIESEGLDSRRVSMWQPLRASEIQDFPMLSLEELQDITVGVYQLKLAPRYMDRHIAFGG